MKTLIHRLRRNRQSLSDRGSAAGRLLPQQELQAQLPDASTQDRELIASIQHLTMTSPQRILALIEAVRYVIKNNIPGDLVECGVWRGGSMVATANTLIAAHQFDRQLWLYDTFQGMSQPTSNDVDYLGQTADRLLSQHVRQEDDSVWCYSPEHQVRQAMMATGYPEDHVHLIAGKVEETLPDKKPERIALLRLDTDWYESTKCELEQLFPRVVNGGVLIIDDYGHWEGCRRAVDEYFQEHGIRILLCRIDYTGRIGIVNRDPS